LIQLPSEKDQPSKGSYSLQEAKDLDAKKVTFCKQQSSENHYFVKNALSQRCMKIK